MSAAPEWTEEALEEYTNVLPNASFRRAVDEIVERWAAGTVKGAQLRGGFEALSVPPFLVVVDPESTPPCVVRIKRYHW